MFSCSTLVPHWFFVAQLIIALAYFRLVSLLIVMLRQRSMFVNILLFYKSLTLKVGKLLTQSCFFSFVQFGWSSQIYLYLIDHLYFELPGCIDIIMG